MLSVRVVSRVLVTLVATPPRVRVLALLAELVTKPRPVSVSVVWSKPFRS